MVKRPVLHWPGIDWPQHSPIPWHTVTDRADTVLIVASGPSLTGFDLTQLHGKGFIIAVNGAANFVTADAWVTVDTLHLDRRLPEMQPRYVAAPEWYGQPQAILCDRRIPSRECRYLRRVDYFSDNPGELCGMNSALGALNLAHHMKAKRVVLFGVDGRNIAEYFYGSRRGIGKQDAMLRRLPEMFAAVRTGMDVLNASPESAVDCFPRCTPDEALARLHVASDNSA